MKNFKSYGFWTALAGAVVVLVNAIGKCCGFAVEEQLITDIIMAIAGVLVVFGVVSMPKKDSEETQNQNEEDAQENADTQENAEDESEKLNENSDENE